MRLFMPRLLILVGFFLFLNSPSALAAGHAFNANFTVLVEAKPSQEQGQFVAEYVLDRAETLRGEIATEWIGRPIPTGVGRTSITVHFHPGIESALTWAKDRPTRTLHSVYLRTTPERVQQAVEEMLPHEIVHVVFATQFSHPNRLPVWIEEGIASRYDDAQRMAIRQETVTWWTQTGDWPQLATLFDAKNLHASDATGYAAAASLVDFLLSRGDKKTLLAFAADGNATGWDAALKVHYQIQSVSRLQSEWQAWVDEAGRVAMQHRWSSTAGQASRGTPPGN
ncbi:MAG: hypothetical protein GXP28_09835 [Planctomycetes bacterium]|nr:hypothetical protein [Planctomycetota bacterium]